MRLTQVNHTNSKIDRTMTFKEAFDIMGFEDSETSDLYHSVAGIMHMGEMKFKQRPREEQAEADGEEDAINAAFNFGVNHEELLKVSEKYKKIRLFRILGPDETTCPRRYRMGQQGSELGAGQLGRLRSGQGHLRPYVQVAH